MPIRRMRTVNQAAAEIRVDDPDTAIGASWIRRQIFEGRLPFIATGNRKLVCLEDIEQLISDMATTAKTEDLW